jgi:putative pyruvate formate lyase activating enzyme
LQEKGAHNINLVTPSHYTIQLINILHKAKQSGLDIPVVWNSNAYETVDTLKRLEGLVDIYLPDLKYASEQHSNMYSGVSDYPSVARLALQEMHRQVGNLQCNAHNIAQKGLIIRLLVLPNQVDGINESLRWIKSELGQATWISLLAQYYPTWKAKDFDEINRGITQNEYDAILLTMDTLGMTNGFTQELSCSSEWTPDFKHQGAH